MILIMFILFVCQAMMSSALVTCYGGGLVPSGGGLMRRDIWVREGRIVEPHHLFFRERKSPDFVLDCSNHIVAPGFIDIQINGMTSFAHNMATMVLPKNVGHELIVLMKCRRIWSGLLHAGVRGCG